MWLWVRLKTLYCVLFLIDSVDMAGCNHARFRCDMVLDMLLARQEQHEKTIQSSDLAPEVSESIFSCRRGGETQWCTSELLSLLGQTEVTSWTVPVWYLGDSSCATGGGQAQLRVRWSQSSGAHQSWFQEWVHLLKSVFTSLRLTQLSFSRPASMLFK